MDPRQYNKFPIQRRYLGACPEVLYILNINKLLYSYNFTIDSESGVEYTEKLLELAHIYELSAYDASYLELAIRKQGVVGTLDNNLKKSCIKYGLKVL
jgi:predicted nucleic acid-binding protein